MKLYRVKINYEDKYGAESREEFFEKKSSAEGFLNKWADILGVKVINDEFEEYDIDEETDYAYGIVEEIETADDKEEEH